MRLSLKIFLLLVIAWCAAFSCGAQSYYFKHYQADDGLAHNAVMYVMQDSKGMIWIGTRGGLNRFDGYTFKNYKNTANKFGNIGNNVITAIAEDKNGMMWIGTGKGLFMYDPRKEVFTQLPGDSQDYINQILIDDEDNLWFLSSSALFKYNQREHKLEDLKIRASCMTFDSHMNLWMGTDEGMINKYDTRNRKITSIKSVDEHKPKNLRSVSKIYATTNDDILIGCFKLGLKLYDSHTGSISSLPLSVDINADMYVRDIISDGAQQYWIATESGIYIYNRATNTARQFTKHDGDPYALADNAVYALCKDNQEGMWAGTFFGGLNYYSRQNARFEKYYPQSGTNSISGDAVREIVPDDKGNLWIGTEDAGVNKFNIETHRFTTYTSTGKKNDISYPNVHGLFALDNQLFIGPFFHGMEIMDTRTGHITDRFNYIGSKNDTVSNFVHRIYLTRDNTLLVGTAYGGAGLFSYNRQLKTFTRIKQMPYGVFVFDIHEDKYGNIWTGSGSQGVYYYNPKTGAHGNIRFGDSVNHKRANEFGVHSILEGSDNYMWVATDGGGLIKLNPTTKTFKKFTTQNGLPSNVIYSILEDNSKHLWISSLKGLICFDMLTGTSKTYTQSNGLITDQFNYNSAYKSPDGKMYFGSVKGMIAFNPEEFTKQEIAPPTYITGFQISNAETVPDKAGSPLSKSILYTDSIVLAHDQNNFSIEFAALNFSSPKVTRYKYLMRGLDKDWTYLNTNRNAYFTDLKPGSYTFIIKAESNVGSWTGNERRLFIKVLPPFWKSTVAYGLYVLLLSISLYLVIRYYHAYLNRKNQNKLQLFEHEKTKEIYESKIEFFTNIAHEIQTPLTLIVGPVERLIKKTEDLPAIKKSLLMVDKNARRLVELTSQLLDFRKTEMNQFGLNFVKVNINSLLKEQVLIFKLEAEKNNIKLTLELPKTEIDAFVDREALVKICSNLISNAIKYADLRTTITVAPFSATADHFTIRISNDGKGIPEEFSDKIFEPFFRLRGNEKPGTGIGLSLAKSLTDLHKGTLKLVSSDVNLTVFELVLPVHQQFEFTLSSWKKIK